MQQSYFWNNYNYYQSMISPSISSMFGPFMMQTGSYFPIVWSYVSTVCLWISKRLGQGGGLSTSRWGLEFSQNYLWSPVERKRSVPKKKWQFQRADSWDHIPTELSSLPKFNLPQALPSENLQGFPKLGLATFFCKSNVDSSSLHAMVSGRR